MPENVANSYLTKTQEKLKVALMVIGHYISMSHISRKQTKPGEGGQKHKARQRETLEVLVRLSLRQHYVQM